MQNLFDEQLRERSGEVLRNITDTVLFVLAFGIGMGKSGYSTRGAYEATKWAEGITLDRVQRAVKHLRSKGWIKGLEITDEGQARLQAFIPEVRSYPKRWNGTWYLVSYDVVETLGWKRDNFRSALLQMGFGKLHQSLWISPYNFLGDVEEYCKSDHLQNYVIGGISKQLGTRESQELADRVWKTKALNYDYVKWLQDLKKWKQEGGEDAEAHFRLVVDYSALLRCDPFLPRPLLPSPWYADRAHKEFKKLDPLKIVEEVMEGSRWKVRGEMKSV